MTHWFGRLSRAALPNFFEAPSGFMVRCRASTASSRDKAGLARLASVDLMRDLWHRSIVDVMDRFTIESPELF